MTHSVTMQPMSERHVLIVFLPRHFYLWFSHNTLLTTDIINYPSLLCFLPTEAEENYFLKKICFLYSSVQIRRMGAKAKVQCSRITFCSCLSVSLLDTLESHLICNPKARIQRFSLVCIRKCYSHLYIHLFQRFLITEIKTMLIPVAKL